MPRAELREQAEEADTQSIGISLQEFGMSMGVRMMRGVFSMMTVGRKKGFILLKLTSEGHFFGTYTKRREKRVDTEELG